MKLIHFILLAIGAFVAHLAFIPLVGIYLDWVGSLFSPGIIFWLVGYAIFGIGAIVIGLIILHEKMFDKKQDKSEEPTL